MTKRKAILDQYGEPIVRQRPRRELVEAQAIAAEIQRHQRGTYDAARDLQDTANHWADSDWFDADSANSREVRGKLVRRSRYEAANNGYADGIANTYADDLVGSGPQLRMQTGSNGFNQLVESKFSAWCEAIGFVEKLWTSARAKHVDGEGLGVVRRNQRINDPIKLDWVLYETEQCQTPYLPFGKPGYVDGVRFDEFGNPLWYDFLKYHPGATNALPFTFQPEQVPAEFVTHWFKRLRPGQHRGIPECTSTLNLGAQARRWRESSLTKAEMQAKLTVLLKSLMNPSDEDADPVAAMSTMDLTPGTMTALPNTVEPVNLAMDTPTAQYEMFHKSLVNEQARPKSMPYIKAACDASGSNYATGRLDHQGYYGSLDRDRCGCNAMVLDVLFAVWFDMAVRVYGWLGGNPDALSSGARLHLWDWPKHRVIDRAVEASSNDIDLKNGSKSLPVIATENGCDYEDELIKKAAAAGITVDQQRRIDVLVNLPQPVLPYVAQLLGMQPPQPQQSSDITALLKSRHVNGAHVNGN